MEQMRAASFTRMCATCCSSNPSLATVHLYATFELAQTGAPDSNEPGVVTIPQYSHVSALRRARTARLRLFRAWSAERRPISRMRSNV